jgi:GNAT superfamily N-acetyltransferase
MRSTSKQGSPVAYSIADSSDAEALVTLRIEAMRESLERIGRFDPERARQRFLAGFSPEYTRRIQANGELVGFFVVKPHEDGLLLDHLYVHPHHQGKGIGAAALLCVLHEAEAKGCSVRVGALRGSPSNHFYARHGFVLVEESEFDNYYVRHATNAL